MKFKVMEKDKVCGVTLYQLYVRKMFQWRYLRCFFAKTKEDAILRAKEEAYNHKYPTVEFKI